MSPEFKGKADMMRNQFIKSGAVTEMATTSSPTTEVWSKATEKVNCITTKIFLENFPQIQQL